MSQKEQVGFQDGHVVRMQMYSKGKSTVVTGVIWWLCLIKCVKLKKDPRSYLRNLSSLKNSFPNYFTCVNNCEDLSSI